MSSRCKLSVSAASSATTEPRRGPGANTANSPKCSPGPSTRNVATSPNGVVIRIAEPALDHQMQRVTRIAVVEHHLMAREPAAPRRRDHLPPLPVIEQLQQ